MNVLIRSVELLYISVGEVCAFLKQCQCSSNWLFRSTGECVIMLCVVN